MGATKKNCTYILETENWAKSYFRNCQNYPNFLNFEIIGGHYFTETHKNKYIKIFAQFSVSKINVHIFFVAPSASSDLSPKPEFPQFFGYENMTNRESEEFQKKNSKFICKENLFSNQVTGKLRLDLVNFT